MADPDTLLDALARIQTEGRQSFAIVAVGEAHYAQFLALNPGVTAEVVGDAYLPAEHRLTAEQQAEMRARGWHGDGQDNWSRDYPEALTLAARQRILHDALDALEEVHHARGAIRLDEVSIQDAASPEATEPVTADPQARATLVTAVLVALFALAVGIAAAVFALG